MKRLGLAKLVLFSSIAAPQQTDTSKATSIAATSHGTQAIDTRIGTLEFTHDFTNGYPTDATIGKLYDERDFQRACQAYLWVRFYQPTESCFDRSWPLPDFEVVR